MAQNILTEAERQANWRLLFDGKTLDGWKTTGQPEGWVVFDEAIMCTVRRGGYLYTEDGSRISTVLGVQTRSENKQRCVCPLVGSAIPSIRGLRYRFSIAAARMY